MSRRLLRPPLRPFTISSALTGLAIWMLAGSPLPLLMGQERRLPQREQALEISLPAFPHPLTIGVAKGGRTMILIRREQLRLIDAQAAEGVTAVDLWADGEDGGIRVRLSIIYNDLSNQEWWKDKKEKVLGEYFVASGRGARPADLALFGLEPFEMRAVTSKPVAYPPGEGPPVTNNTASLEVVRIEKSIDRYSLLLKNNSGKGVVAYQLSFGSGGVGVGGAWHPSAEVLIAAGASRWEESLAVANIGSRGINVRGVLFDDGTFEGDESFAAACIARGEGQRLQMPGVVLLLRRALEAADDDLERALETLESDLWKMPEALDKAAAVELLKGKFSHLAERAILGLYENLKAGLYDARNNALSPIGDLKRRLKDDPQFAGDENSGSRMKMIRQSLEATRDRLEKMLAVR